MRRASLIRAFSYLCVLCVLCGEAPRAQVQGGIPMPDPKQMSGIPRQDSAVPQGSVTVRLIRGDLANRITDQAVELFVDGKPLSAKTDAEGRAQFDKLMVGKTLKAVAVVDGERLESQEFQVPASGPGIRLMLVATDKEKEARKAAEASAPAISGQVTLGGETRIIIEPGDEAVELYYFLDIVNNERAPVNPSAAFTFEMPEGAIATTKFEGSTPLAIVNGTHIRVNGPFPPGVTQLQLFCRLPVITGNLTIKQEFPARIEQLLVMAKKTAAEMRLSSPQLERQQDMPSNGDVVIFAAGGTVAAGQPVVLDLTGLPHHSPTPRYIALGTAILVVLIGIVVARRPRSQADQKEDRKRLIARREKLFQELVKLEQDHRAGRGNPSKYASRREELLNSLERVYGSLETGDGPEPGDRTGIAA